MRFVPILPLVLAISTTSWAVDAPKLVEKNGRHALFVDGAPYLVLGAQINNSSSWSSTLPQVWPALEAMHANTIEAPIYWEQMEPHPGIFDFSSADMLVQQARQHKMHLVLLWFGTWKNGNMHYVPQWMKEDTKSYPRVINRAGEPIDVLSANSKENMEADKHAFTALMHHLAEIDSTEHTVILIQVENESGIIGSPRDYSPASNQEFEGPVPADLLHATSKDPGDWRHVFGADADEVFQAYHQAKYINEIAQAGKREFNIPMYCNVWLSYPIAELPERQIGNPGIGWPSGGPVQHTLKIWKTLAPSIDVIGPDMYSDDLGFYTGILKQYGNDKNALWIPETGSGDSYARFLFLALNYGAIGFSPFGVDRTGWTFSDTEGPKLHTENYALLEPLSRELAQLNFEGKIKATVDAPGQSEQELDFGTWKAAIRFGFPQPDGKHAPGTPNNTGRVLVAQLAANEFLVTGFDVSVAFHTEGRLPGIRMQILSAEEGHYERGEWKTERLWNGDQTDRGLNFQKDNRSVVRIKVGTF